MRLSLKLIILCSFTVLFVVSGCYTQLMTPQDYMKIRKQKSVAPIVNNSYSINYNQSCTSCHSVAELNERAEELEYYGVRTVHDGVLLSDRQWLTENPGEIYYGDPGPTYWPTPTYPSYPWWLPAPAIVIHGSEQNQGTAPTPKKKRADNPSRGTEANTGREQPAPTYTSPVSVPQSSPPPTVSTGTSTSPVTIQQQPSQSPPAQPQSSGSRDSNSSSGKTAPTKKRSD